MRTLALFGALFVATPILVLACKKVSSVPGLTIGLDAYMDI